MVAVLDRLSAIYRRMLRSLPRVRVPHTTYEDDIAQASEHARQLWHEVENGYIGDVFAAVWSHRMLVTERVWILYVFLAIYAFTTLCVIRSFWCRRSARLTRMLVILMVVLATGLLAGRTYVAPYVPKPLRPLGVTGLVFVLLVFPTIVFASALLVANVVRHVVQPRGQAAGAKHGGAPGTCGCKCGAKNPPVRSADN